MFAEGLEDNPRQIKRTVNVFLMLWQLAQERRQKLQDKIRPIRLAKVVAIQAIAPELYKLLNIHPGLLRHLEVVSRQKLNKSKASSAETGDDEPEAGEEGDGSPRRQAELYLAEKPQIGRLLTMLTDAIPKANPENSNLILDFSAVDFMSSAGWRVVITLYKAIRRRKRQMLLVGLRQGLQDALELAGFDRLFTVCTSLDEALKLLTP